jgi:hypothetical protein
LPEADRAAYLEWVLRWQDPDPYAAGPTVELQSIAEFCIVYSSDCPSGLGSKAAWDRAMLASTVIGAGFGAADMVGNDGGVGAGVSQDAPDLGEEEEAAAWDDLDQLECDGLSFTAGTRVLLADGKSKPISDIKPGDKVIATNLTTGETQAESVTAVLVRHDTDLYDLKIKADGRTAVIGTTSNHPFWVPNSGGHGGRWVKAGALRYGNRLRGPGSSSSSVVVGGWVSRQSAGWMWDLTVPGDNDHDFYIGTAVSQVLVHNASCSTSGNNGYAALGKRVHQAFSNMLNQMGNGYSGARSIGNNLSIDGAWYDPSLGKDVPVELKPNTPGNLASGWNQLGNYENEMDVPEGSGQLWMYSFSQDGAIIFRRVL